MLKDSEGRTVCKPDEVRLEIEKYYKELYSKEQGEESDNEGSYEEEFLGCSSEKLNEEESRECEGQIGEKELLAALKGRGPCS